MAESCVPVRVSSQTSRIPLSMSLQSEHQCVLQERLTKAAQEAARRAQAAAQPPAPSAARPQPISQPPPKPKPRVTAFRNPLLGGLPGQQQEITPQKLSGALPQEAGRSHPSGPQTPAQTSGAGASPVATSGALPGVGPQGVSRTASQPKRAAPGERSAQHSAAQPEQADQVPAAGGQAGECGLGPATVSPLMQRLRSTLAHLTRMQMTGFWRVHSPCCKIQALGGSFGACL